MSSDMSNKYSVNWQNHMSHMCKAFQRLLTSNELVDVTLSCEGRKIGAHKTVLSACSGYFRETFQDVPCQHPVIVLYGIEYTVLSDILHFIYTGEVSVDTAKLDPFLKTAQLLQINGLTDGYDKDNIVQKKTTTNTEQIATSAHPILNNTTQQSLSTETIVAANTISEEPRRNAKRLRTKEPETEPNDEILLENVKSEPQDPQYGDGFESTLQTEIHLNDTKDFIAEGALQNIEDVESKQNKNSWPLNTVKCNICDKVFSHPYSLQQHKPVHAGNTRCPICNAVLSRKYHLKLHMKARHNLI